MTDTKHTPGPWCINISSGYTDIEASENATRKIAMLNGEDDDMELDELEANARLISKAPAMYALLERWQEFIHLQAPGKKKIPFKLAQDTINLFYEINGD
jgi:hypothetical protein